MSIPRIAPGLEMVDDEGDHVVVADIDESDDTVELETRDGESYSIPLRELRSKLRDGDFAEIEPDTEQEVEDEDP
jgi:hypothetical protein